MLKLFFDGMNLKAIKKYYLKVISRTALSEWGIKIAEKYSKSVFGFLVLKMDKK